MRVTFAASSNTATNGVALSSNFEDDVRVFKLIVGAPVSAGNIWLYSINNPINGATGNIAFKATLPTFSSTNVNPGVYVIDFGSEGLPLTSGGNLVIDQTMNVSVLWELNDDAQN
jgi:hypothetical protein